MTEISALLSCTVLGLQHGVDVDHVAAISDVTSIQTTPRDAVRSGLLYAAGHAVTVGLIGVAFITLQRSVPAGFSIWMQRIVGLTLIALGAYVLRAAVIGTGPVGRGAAIRALIGKFRPSAKEAHIPADSTYGPKSSVGLGVLHGVGAETPTQLSVLLIAANMGGLTHGVLALSMFAAGMFASNMALTTAATGVFDLSRRSPWIFRWLGGLTSIYSLWIGIGLMVR